jgi:hypothetical protein
MRSDKGGESDKNPKEAELVVNYNHASLLRHANDVIVCHDFLAFNIASAIKYDSLARCASPGHLSSSDAPQETISDCIALAAK